MIHVAYAASSASNSGDGGFMLIVLSAIVAMLYFTVVRPQQQQAKAHERLIKGVKPGDEIITNGGLYGQVLSVDETSVQVQITDAVTVRLQRSSISRLLPKGTLRNTAKD